jgi:hypothetical protein
MIMYITGPGTTTFQDSIHAIPCMEERRQDRTVRLEGVDAITKRCPLRSQQLAEVGAPLA